MVPARHLLFYARRFLKIRNFLIELTQINLIRALINSRGGKFSTQNSSVTVTFTVNRVQCTYKTHSTAQSRARRTRRERRQRGRNDGRG